MNAVPIEVKLWNLTDLEDARRRLIPAGVIRMATLEATVAADAPLMAIPEDVALALGLRLLEIATVVLADGTRQRIPKVGGLRIEILGRQMTCDAFVIPRGTAPIIGHILFSGLDLIVDPATREVGVRLESGPEHNLLRVAA